MASVEQAVIDYLLADAPLGAIVGNRITPNSREQGGELPAVTVTRISGAPIYADDGEAGLLSARIQVDGWAGTYTDAKNTGLAIAERLSGVRDVSQSGVQLIFITLDNEQDFREGGSGVFEYLHRVSLDFIVWSDY